MNLVILEKGIGRWAAEHVVGRINSHQPRVGKPFVLGLPTGSTPISMYDELAALCRQKKVSFREVITFNMDDYVGLAKDHPQSYHRYMKDHFFGRVDICRENVNIPDGNAEDLMAACKRYEAKIAAYGGVDLFIGGLGPNGHIAFNEPGAEFSSRTRIVNLSRETREANSRFFDRDVRNVPRKAITVGIATLMDAKEILLLVSGEKKARALKQAIDGSPDPMWPVSVLQRHSDTTIVCDTASAVELEAKTIQGHMSRSR